MVVVVVLANGTRDKVTRVNHVSAYIHGAIGGASGAARGVQCGGRDGETVREVRRRSGGGAYIRGAHTIDIGYYISGASVGTVTRGSRRTSLTSAAPPRRTSPLSSGATSASPQQRRHLSRATSAAHLSHSSALSSSHVIGYVANVGEGYRGHTGPEFAGKRKMTPPATSASATLRSDSNTGGTAQNRLS